MNSFYKFEEWSKRQSSQTRTDLIIWYVTHISTLSVIDQWNETSGVVKHCVPPKNKKNEYTIEAWSECCILQHDYERKNQLNLETGSVTLEILFSFSWFPSYLFFLTFQWVLDLIINLKK